MTYSAMSAFTQSTYRWFSVAPEFPIAIVGVVAGIMFPEYFGLLTQIVIKTIFVFSLALVIGQAGIGTLGQAAFFGSGSYGAALWAIYVSAEPISGLFVGSLTGAIVAAASGILILRTRGLTLVMLTVAFAQVLLEIANKASGLTGGDDGLSGIPTDPIFGVFAFDFRGQVAFWYSLFVLLIIYFCARRLAASPFGLTCRGIKGDPVRMRASGTPVFKHLVIVYTIGGLIAGAAGALSAQTARVVGLSSLSFDISAEGLVMLTIGGVGNLAGAFLGVPVFMLIRHLASAINPYHWLLVIGSLLIATILLLPKGIFGLVEKHYSKFIRSP